MPLFSSTSNNVSRGSKNDAKVFGACRPILLLREGSSALPFHGRGRWDSYVADTCRRSSQRHVPGFSCGYRSTASTFPRSSILRALQNRTAGILSLIAFSCGSSHD
ncbi:hypothetical protein TNIN_72661 [Trichonephila inaurata madagascariensis]|uniref:Uncharacterized protein n=1 Tax=Trichonephila inaurata madagascariensis TaxID=2747483 RepID=A0A8X7BUG9_9ARAC|nr:hypothetical protein TNIN_72661 [Trichonephila inaurata madagascariensis]